MLSVMSGSRAGAHGSILKMELESSRRWVERLSVTNTRDMISIPFSHNTDRKDASKAIGTIDDCTHGGVCLCGSPPLLRAMPTSIDGHDAWRRAERTKASCDSSCELISTTTAVCIRWTWQWLNSTNQADFHLGRAKFWNHLDFSVSIILKSAWHCAFYWLGTNSIMFTHICYTQSPLYLFQSLSSCRTPLDSIQALVSGPRCKPIPTATQYSCSCSSSRTLRLVGSHEGSSTSFSSSLGLGMARVSEHAVDNGTNWTWFEYHQQEYSSLSTGISLWWISLVSQGAATTWNV